MASVVLLVTAITFSILEPNQVAIILSTRLMHLLRFWKYFLPKSAAKDIRYNHLPLLDLGG